jgi:hypothetical protein
MAALNLDRQARAAADDGARHDKAPQARPGRQAPQARAVRPLSCPAAAPRDLPYKPPRSAGRPKRQP